MDNNIFYFPIMCCGQEMVEIWGDGKRLAAFCQKCGKNWEPKSDNNIKFGKKYAVTIDEWTPEMEEEAKSIVKNSLAEIYRKLESDTIFGCRVVVDPSMPKNEIKLVGSDGKIVRIVNIGKKENQNE